MNMITGNTTGKLAITRLPVGSDLLDGINELATKSGFKAATVQFIGAVRKAVVQAYDERTKKYETIEVEGPLEILSGMGTISLREGAPFAHIHVVLSDLKGKCSGGHVTKGTEVFIAEIVLTELATDTPLCRTFDQETELFVW